MVTISFSDGWDIISLLFFFEQANSKKTDNNKIKKPLNILDKKIILSKYLIITIFLDDIYLCTNSYRSRVAVVFFVIFCFFFKAFEFPI